MAIILLIRFFSLSVCLRLALFSATATSAPSLYNSGTSVTFNDIPYFIPPYAAGVVPEKPPSIRQSVSIAGLYPMTVLPAVSTSNFSAVVDGFRARDDVFQPAFLQIVYVPQDSDLAEDEQEIHGVEAVVKVMGSTDLPPGPYFLVEDTGEVYAPYRLYSDHAAAFTEGIYATPDGNFTTLPTAVSGAASLTIGVPSRLYYSPSLEKPLAGVRVGIKDVYDVAGVKTGNGNRAWYNLYPPASANSIVAQKLIDAGAILVGKQKTSQFANGERATADWVDYQAPFNARGDGYQDPSSSSSGAGASMATYPWLDIAVGSDTGGSIRGPSQVQGLFGNRPSHNAVELTGILPLSPALDTAGFLARDPQLWAAAQTVLYGGVPSYTAYPSKILTYGFPINASSSPGNGLILGFLAKLQSFLSANVSSFDVTSAWAASRPSNVTASLIDYLNITYSAFVSKQQTALVRDPFYADYKALHDGRTPYIDPSPRIRWHYGDTLPVSALDEAYNNKTVFMNWFNSNVLVPDINTCSNAFLLYSGFTGTSTARDQYLLPPTVPFGFNAGRLSVFAEVPDSVYPIGQVPFFSEITQHTEYLPVSVDILAAKGCDGIIFRLAQDLVKAGILKATKAGQTIYGGDVLHKRGMEDGDQ